MKEERKKISYAVTDSASRSAVIFALNQLPSVLLQPFAGPLVEKMNKKRVMVSGLICVLLFGYIKIRKVQFE